VGWHVVELICRYTQASLQVKIRLQGSGVCMLIAIVGEGSMPQLLR
jgi:hypothetical protein